MRWWVPCVGFLLFSPLGQMALLHADLNNLIIRSEKGVRYINVAPGEISGSESDKNWLEQFNTKIIFEAGKKDPYAGVFVRVYNAAGIKIVGYLCDKPWLLLRLPAGDYHVIAIDRQRQQRIKPFRVREMEGKMDVVKLLWPKEPINPL